MPVELSAVLTGFRPDLLGRLLLAAVLGGLVGVEREIHGKPAGLRTNLLICVGAALLTDLSVHMTTLGSGPTIRADPARIAAQIVSGIGFLGAGTIIQSRGSVMGLTTAATLWVVAAIGIGVGSGHHLEAVGATALVLIALVPLGRFEAWMHRRRTTRSIQIVARRRKGVVDELNALLEGEGLDTQLEGVETRAESEEVVVTFQATGSEDAFEVVRVRLVASDEVPGFTLGHRD